MGKKGKIRAGHVPGKRIPEPTLPPVPSHIYFSFKYLQLICDRGPKFSIYGLEWNYFNKLLLRLKDVCRMETGEFQGPRPNRTIRNHTIEWAETTESGFPSHIVDEQIGAGTAFQFSVSSNEHGRVHGSIVGNIFYVIWLDPKHELYS